MSLSLHLLLLYLFHQYFYVCTTLRQSRSCIPRPNRPLRRCKMKCEIWYHHRRLAARGSTSNFIGSRRSSRGFRFPSEDVVRGKFEEEAGDGIYNRHVTFAGKVVATRKDVSGFILFCHRSRILVLRACFRREQIFLVDLFWWCSWSNIKVLNIHRKR